MPHTSKMIWYFSVLIPFSNTLIPLAFTNILKDKAPIISFSRYLLNTYYIPNTVLDSGDASVSKKKNDFAVTVLPF